MNAIQFYTNLHIYDFITKHTELSEDEKHKKISIIFKQLINKIRVLSITHEIDKFNTPMGILFQHLKPTIIRLIANCFPTNIKKQIDNLPQNNIEFNKLIFNKLIQLEAKDTLLWFLFQIPYYVPDTKLTDIYRHTYIQLLDHAIANWPRNLYMTEAEFIFASNETCMPYAAAYHNRNNIKLLTTFCSLLRTICPWLNYYSPSLSAKLFKKYPAKMGDFAHSAVSPLFEDGNTLTENTLRYPPDHTPARVRRICFITDSMSTDTSVLRDRISIIGKLDRNLYDVYLASFHKFDKIGGIVARLFANKIKDKYIYLGDDISSARAILEPFEFDFIVYPDLGMKLLPTLLAYSRIAPVQMTTWGHSDTSGIDTIDYYISSAFFTLDNDQFSETVINMSSLGTFYISPKILFIDNNPDYISGQKKLKTRDELGFKATQVIYGCLQTFYKFNETFESCLATILELDPNGILLLSNSIPFCKSHLHRIKQRFGDEKLKRVMWYGSLEKDQFLNLVSVCDVCLDPFPFGGCNTSYDAFDFNIPVITIPGKLISGRFTYGLYKKMGLEDCECVVPNEMEYAKAASNIGINLKLRHKMNRNIEINKHKIFQEKESVDEWNALFTNIKPQ